MIMSALLLRRRRTGAVRSAALRKSATEMPHVSLKHTLQNYTRRTTASAHAGEKNRTELRSKSNELEPPLGPIRNAVHERRQAPAGQNHEPARHGQTRVRQERHEPELAVRRRADLPAL